MHFLQALGKSVHFSEPLSPRLSLGGGDIVVVELLAGCYRLNVHVPHGSQIHMLKP